MDTATPDLPGWFRRQTSAQPNQPGEAFTKLSIPCPDLDPQLKPKSSWSLLLTFYQSKLLSDSPLPLLLFFLQLSVSVMSASPVNHSYFFLSACFICLGAAHLAGVLALVLMHVFLIKTN